MTRIMHLKNQVRMWHKREKIILSSQSFTGRQIQYS